MMYPIISAGIHVMCMGKGDGGKGTRVTEGVRKNTAAKDYPKHKADTYARHKGRVPVCLPFTSIKYLSISWGNATALLSLSG